MFFVCFYAGCIWLTIGKQFSFGATEEKKNVSNNVHVSAIRCLSFIAAVIAVVVVGRLCFICQL